MRLPSYCCSCVDSFSAVMRGLQPLVTGLIMVGIGVALVSIAIAIGG